jgi:hypothetical protein
MSASLIGRSGSSAFRLSSQGPAAARAFLNGPGYIRFLQEKQMKWLWDWATKATIIWALVTAVFTIVGVAVGFYVNEMLTEQRISKIEHRLESQSAKAPANPMLAVCADLAKEAATASHVARSWLIDEMEKMNCDARR